MAHPVFLMHIQSLISGYAPDIYIYIRVVTVHKIHGSVRYDKVGVTVRDVFDTGAGHLVTSQCWKYFCFQP